MSCVKRNWPHENYPQGIPINNIIYVMKYMTSSISMDNWCNQCSGSLLLNSYYHRAKRKTRYIFERWFSDYGC